MLDGDFHLLLGFIEDPRQTNMIMAESFMSISLISIDVVYIYRVTRCYDSSTNGFDL